MAASSGSLRSVYDATPSLRPRHGSVPGGVGVAAAARAPRISGQPAASTVAFIKSLRRMQPPRVQESLPGPPRTRARLAHQLERLDEIDVASAQDHADALAGDARARTAPPRARGRRWARRPA